ncbi:MAG: HIT domain-containing protein [Bdellovibrionota bacterium]
MERTVIHDRVDKARAGENPYVICKLETCWVALSDEPFTRGHCVTFADPVVFGLNDLPEDLRMRYLRDVARVGDALISALGAYRINYETLCNVAQALHSHVIPRYKTEPDDKRRDRPSSAYPGPNRLREIDRRELMLALKEKLKVY